MPVLPDLEIYRRYYRLTFLYLLWGLKGPRFLEACLGAFRRSHGVASPCGWEWEVGANHGQEDKEDLQLAPLYSMMHCCFSDGVLLEDVLPSLYERPDLGGVSVRDRGLEWGLRWEYGHGHG